MTIPDVRFEEKKNQTEPYDFTMPAFDTPPPINQMVGGQNLKVSFEKPSYLDQIVTDPKFIVDCDPRELEDAAMKGAQTKPYLGTTKDRNTPTKQNDFRRNYDKGGDDLDEPF